jgi:hypothetical protein
MSVPLNFPHTLLNLELKLSYSICCTGWNNYLSTSNVLYSNSKQPLLTCVCIIGTELLQPGFSLVWRVRKISKSDY